MIEVAQGARDRTLLAHLESLSAQLLVARAAARAVWRDGVSHATRRVARHSAATDFSGISSGRVKLPLPPSFEQRPDRVQRERAPRSRSLLEARAARNIATISDDIKLPSLERKAAIWSPWSRRLARRAEAGIDAAKVRYDAADISDALIPHTLGPRLCEDGPRHCSGAAMHQCQLESAYVREDCPFRYPIGPRGWRYVALACAGCQSSRALQNPRLEQTVCGSARQQRVIRVVSVLRYAAQFRMMPSALFTEELVALARPFRIPFGVFTVPAWLRLQEAGGAATPSLRAASIAVLSRAADRPLPVYLQWREWLHGHHAVLAFSVQ